MEANELLANVNYISLDASTGTIAGYMSFAEAADKWGVVLGTMYAWRERKKLQGCIKIGDRYYIPENSTKPQPRRRGRSRKEES